MCQFHLIHVFILRYHMVIVLNDYRVCSCQGLHLGSRSLPLNPKPKTPKPIYHIKQKTQYKYTNPFSSMLLGHMHFYLFINFSYIRGFDFIVTHTCHLGLQQRGHPSRRPPQSGQCRLVFTFFFCQTMSYLFGLQNKINQCSCCNLYTHIYKLVAPH